MSLLFMVKSINLLNQTKKIKTLQMVIDTNEIDKFKFSYKL